MNNFYFKKKLIFINFLGTFYYLIKLLSSQYVIKILYIGNNSSQNI